MPGAGYFPQKATNYRALVRKMTYEDKAFYDSTPLCTHTTHIPTRVYVPSKRLLCVYMCLVSQSGVCLCLAPQ